jgi:hypothetical protein
MKKLILLLTVITLSFSCSSDSNNSNNNNNSVDPACQSQDFVTKFNSIPNNATYNDIKAVFNGVDGDNYRNDQIGNSVLRFYKWYPCSDHNYYVDFWLFDNTTLLTKNRTIYDYSNSSNNVTSTSFSLLANGMSYNQIKTILNCDGDNYRVDVDTNIYYYRFYNSNDTSKYIDAWIKNGGAILLQKNL